MKLKIEAVRYEGGELIIKTGSPEARRLAYKFRPGEYELKQSRQKRSLDANAYCWALCSEIAAAAGTTKEEVYRREVMHGNQFYVATVPDTHYKGFVKDWTSRGLGWQTQLVDDIGGVKTVLAYYGSSSYDTKAMSKLINGLLDEAHNMGIPTLDDERINSLLDEWERRYEHG